MTYVFDAAALIGWFNEEPGADDVEALFATDGGAASSVNLAEVVDILVRLCDVPASHASSLIETLLDDGLVALPCDASTAVRAGTVRATRYRKGSMEVSLADCVAVATAQVVEGTLVTSDAQLVRLAGDLGVGVRPIPNSLGIRPER